MTIALTLMTLLARQEPAVMHLDQKLSQPITIQVLMPTTTHRREAMATEDVIMEDMEEVTLRQSMSTQWVKQRDRSTTMRPSLTLPLVVSVHAVEIPEALYLTRRCIYRLSR